MSQEMFQELTGDAFWIPIALRTSTRSHKDNLHLNDSLASKLHCAKYLLYHVHLNWCCQRKLNTMQFCKYLALLH